MTLLAKPTKFNECRQRFVDFYSRYDRRLKVSKSIFCFEKPELNAIVVHWWGFGKHFSQVYDSETLKPKTLN